MPTMCVQGLELRFGGKHLYMVSHPSSPNYLPFYSLTCICFSFIRLAVEKGSALNALKRIMGGGEVSRELKLQKLVLFVWLVFGEDRFCLSSVLPWLSETFSGRQGWP